MLSSKNMAKNVIETFEETFSTWKPRKRFEFIKADKLPIKKVRHKIVY